MAATPSSTAQSRLAGSSLYNSDLAPVPAERRTWSTYNYSALWISMSVNILTYMLAASLIQGGMDWKQALATVFVGNCIVLAPMLLNSHPGARYGIPFPILARASFGVLGANVAALLRAIVACGWFGIQTWIGGEAINTLLATLWPQWKQVPLAPWLCFFLFWLINLVVIIKGVEWIRVLQGLSAPVLIGVGLLLLVWAYRAAHGFGPMLSAPSKFANSADFLKFFVPALNGTVGFWATLSLNIPDFTRFARGVRQQAVGQAVALPTTMFVFAAMGVLITSASAILYGEPIWDPVKLVGRFQSPVVVGFAMFSVVVATLAVNIAANVVSPANDFANALPRWISFRTGGLITGLIGIAMQPWRLLADPKGYIFAWLVGYSGGLGSIAGVLIADYWILRRRQLDLADLYLSDGRYGGWNMAAVIATLAGCALAWGGLVVPPLRPLYDYAWFVGFFSSGVIYLALARRTAAPAPVAKPVP